MRSKEEKLSQLVSDVVGSRSYWNIIKAMYLRMTSACWHWYSRNGDDFHTTTAMSDRWRQ